jgi:hypothetical protein
MHNKYWRQEKNGRGYALAQYESETECAAMALPVEGQCTFPEIRATGDTVDEAKTRLHERIDQIEARR